MKPFDCYEASCGAEVQTIARGFGVKDLTTFETEKGIEFVGICNGEVRKWNSAGETDDPNYNLCMSGNQRKVYMQFHDYRVFPTIEAFKKEFGDNAEFVTLEWVE